MPPPIPRPSLCSLTSRAAPSSRRATTTMLQNSFTTSAIAQQTANQPTQPQTRIPPESPKYISVPEPPQSVLARRPPVRGHLPVPREIFPRRGGDRKTAPDYAMRATPLSLAEEAGEPPKTELEAWRRRMAHSRRNALKAGIKGLYERKTQADAYSAAKTREKGDLHRAAAMAPERRDDVLTRSSVLRSVVDAVDVAQDPARFQAAKASKRRTARLAKRKAEERADALGELYLAAGNFIVDEKELARKVDELFDENYFAAKGVSDALSIWDTDGPPIKTNAMVDQQGYGRDNVVSVGYEMYQPDSTRTARKQKILAEELTGGKL